MTTPNPTNPANPSPEDIFHQARAIPSEADRAAFLAQACGGNAELRAKIEALLKAEADAGSFLSTKNKPPAGATVPSTPLERPGQTIGRYKLLQLIGEGGFGSVYLAEQSEPVRRRIALKIIKPGMDSRMVAARFEAERQALALMDHPHIARVFDGGITDAAMGARPYFVMEYVIGDPITNFADAHKLSLINRLNLFTQVCEAVQHAHTKGIIHRDLKPTNILVSMTDGKPFAKVIDFGIAKATGAAGGRLTDKTLFTEHRQLIGTPEYMSPEQAEGSPDIDTRTDVYALGVLLYELLTGATPFDAARLRSAAFAEMQRIIKEEDPPTPSIRLSRQLGKPPVPIPVPSKSASDFDAPHAPAGIHRSLRADFDGTKSSLAAIAAARSAEPSRLGSLIKGELDWIVMKALDKDRARRYESPNQFAADVRRHLAGEAVVAAPASVGYRVRKFVRRNKGSVVGVGAVGAAMSIGLAGTTWQWQRANQFSSDAQLQADAARIAKEQAEDQRDALSKAKDSINREAERLLSALNRVVVELAKDEIPAQNPRLEWTTPGGEKIDVPIPEEFFAGEGGEFKSFDILELLEASTMESIRIGRETRNSLKATTAQLQAEVERARMAEADAYVLSWSPVAESEGCVSDPPRALAEMRIAASTREELRGLGDPATIDAFMLLAAIGDDPQEDDRRLSRATEAWNAQNPVPTMRSLKLWARAAWASTEMHDFERAAKWYRLIGGQLVSFARSHNTSEFSELWSLHNLPWEPNERGGQVLRLSALESLAHRLETCDASFVQHMAIDQWIKDITWGSLVTSPTPSRRCAAEGRHRLARVLPLIDAMAASDPRAERSLGRAYFRLGNYSKALSAFTKASEVEGDLGDTKSPEDKLYLAMAHFKLGGESHLALAHSTLSQLRSLMQNPANAQTWAEDPDAQSLLAEAEALIDPK